jgi:low-affinity ferrous iron transport protein
MSQFLRSLCVPVFKKEIQGVAPMQRLFQSDGQQSPPIEKEKEAVALEVPVESIQGYIDRVKPRRLDRWLDVVVRWSGSEYVFFSIIAGLLVWAFLGIRFAKSLTWQAMISDVQAILSYVFDSFLMRQQMNGYEDSLGVWAELRSRGSSSNRMLRKLVAGIGKDELARLAVKSQEQDKMISEFNSELPGENWFGRVVTAFSRVLGHLITVALYWACIVIWLGFGASCGWSDIWELYINSATSALMVFVFSFLANIRERHSEYTKRCLDSIFRVDAALELKLRTMTGDQQDNELIVIPPPAANVVQKVIFYYADVVGTLVGIVILIIVIIIWLAVGPVMLFSSNWWLFIGTYAGLVGMNDGFVLRNVQSKLSDYEDLEFDKVNADDAALFEITGLRMPDRVCVQTRSLTNRVSSAMNKVCAHEITVIAGFLVIIGLLIGSSVMQWNTTGQLISNIPPSIIESFFMIILITGHNDADAAKRVDLKHLYERRLALLSFVNRVGVAESFPTPEPMTICN